MVNSTGHSYGPSPLIVYRPSVPLVQFPPNPVPPSGLNAYGYAHTRPTGAPLDLSRTTPLIVPAGPMSTGGRLTARPGLAAITTRALRWSPVPPSVPTQSAPCAVSCGLTNSWNMAGSARARGPRLVAGALPRADGPPVDAWESGGPIIAPRATAVP